MKDVGDVREDWSLSQLVMVQKPHQMQQLKECVDGRTDETQTRFSNERASAKVDSCLFYASPVQSPPQLTGFVATGDEENQYSALDQSQLTGAGGSGVTQERLPVPKIHSGHLVCWYHSLTIRAIIWEMIYSSVTKSCCQLWLSLCWCYRRRKSKKENRKRKLTDNGRL